MINTIIFDIGRVLVRFEWKEYLEGYGFPEEVNKAVSHALFSSSTWNEMDRGAHTDEEIIHAFIQNAPEYPEEIRKVFEKYPSSITQMPYAIPWVKRLKEQGLHIYYLSNYGKTTYQKTRHELSFMNYMDGGLMSYEVKMVKPESSFYQELFSRYQIDPESSIFIDDNEANIAAAKELGLHTILFTGYDAAIQELRNHYHIF